MSPVITIVRCPRCRQPVYAAEQVLAGGKKWHSLCFNCGLCNKPLSSTSVSVHEGDIFCKQCYSRLFGIRGVGFGMGAGTLSMDTGDSFKLHQDLVEQARRSMLTAAPQQPMAGQMPGAQGQYKRPERMTTTAALYSQPIPQQRTQQADSSYDLPATAPLHQRFNNPNLNEYAAPIQVPSYSPQPNRQVPIDDSLAYQAPQMMPAYPGGSQPQPYASSPIQQASQTSVPIVRRDQMRGAPQYPQSSF